jgi:hypothetical protein
MKMALLKIRNTVQWSHLEKGWIDIFTPLPNRTPIATLSKPHQDSLYVYAHDMH